MKDIYAVSNQYWLSANAMNSSSTLENLFINFAFFYYRNSSCNTKNIVAIVAREINTVKVEIR